MVLKRLAQFLDENNVKYFVITHSQAFTAGEVAALAHLPGKEVAKTVVIKADGGYFMVVLPATEMINFKLLKDIAGVQHATLASESEFAELFPKCEVGAMPPFGNLFDMKVYVSQTLAEDREIAFNAGTHRELVKLSYADFSRLVKPILGRFTVEKRSVNEEDARYLM